MATAVSAYNFPKFIAVCSEIVEGQKVETNFKDLIEKFLCVASLLENDDKRKGTIFYALLAACRVITRSEEALVTLGALSDQCHYIASLLGAGDKTRFRLLYGTFTAARQNLLEGSQPRSNEGSQNGSTSGEEWQPVSTKTTIVLEVGTGSTIDRLRKRRKCVAPISRNEGKLQA